MRRTADTRAVQRLRTRPRLDPLTVPGCVLWLDMLRPSSYTVTGGTTVTSITNMASGVAWTEAVAPPTYSATGLNGRPCMVGDGLTMKILSSEAAVVAAFTGDDTPITVFAVVEPVTLDTSSAVVGAGDVGIASSNTYQIGQANSGNGRWTVRKVDPAGLADSAIGGSDIAAGPQIVSWIMGAAGSTRIYKDFSLQITDTVDVAAMTCSRVALFTRPDSAPDSFYDGKLGCVLVYSRALTDYERLNLAGSLAAPWGI